MRKLIGAIAALAILGLTNIAAAEEEASGKVTAVDPAAKLIQLEDGTVYTIGEGVSIEGLQPGTEVTVSYEEQGGQNVATDVMAK